MIEDDNGPSDAEIEDQEVERQIEAQEETQVDDEDREIERQIEAQEEAQEASTDDV
jgi:hypothetical protein